MTEIYTAITKDNEVTSIEQVQVRRVKEILKDWGTERSSEILTLQAINTKLQVVRGQIQNLQAEEIALLTTKTKMEKAAAEVVLKVEEIIK